MNAAQILRAAEEFWMAAGGREPFPRNLDGPVTWALPLAIVKLPRLWLDDVKAWLLKHGYEIDLFGHNRNMRACLIAFRGKGFVLLDGTDPSDHQRYSLAHEIAHFIVDYLVPRENAVRKFGDSILDVLDGIRRATHMERLSSVLSEISIRPHVHLMERHEDGSFSTGEIALSERNADRLALELLAPASEVKECVGSLKGRSQDHKSPEIFEDVLKAKFGLPSPIATEYAQWLCREHDAEFSIRKWLGL